MYSVFYFSLLKQVLFFPWKNVLLDYIITGCARRGASGALFPKSALCGAEFPLKGLNTENWQVILIGHCATDGHEPRQVRKEAAISDAVCVADRSRSYFRLVLFRNRFDRGCTTVFIFKLNRIYRMNMILKKRKCLHYLDRISNKSICIDTRLSSNK